MPSKIGRIKVSILVSFLIAALNLSISSPDFSQWLNWAGSIFSMLALSTANPLAKTVLISPHRISVQRPLTIIYQDDAILWQNSFPEDSVNSWIVILEAYIDEDDVEHPLQSIKTANSQQSRNSISVVVTDISGALPSKMLIRRLYPYLWNASLAISARRLSTSTVIIWLYQYT